MPDRTTNNTILRAWGLKTYFPVRAGAFSGVRGFVRAVDGVDLAIRRGGALGLVGESGSGKTTVGRTVLRLVPASAGRVTFDGLDVFSLGQGALRRLRRRMQIIFQDPVGSLNPRMTVGDIVGEGLAVHRIVPRRDRHRRVGELLERVGLPAACASRYPHEFSGGQRQRIGIARALAPQPDFIVCDEPVSALDVSIQAQILNLLKDLQEDLGLSYLFIAHNLAVVEHFADTVAVMYLGRIVECAPRDALYSRPMHPYTEALLASAPRPDPNLKVRRVPLTGEVPSPVNPPSGCRFHTRCPLTRELAREMDPKDTATVISQGLSIKVVARCMREEPVLRPVAECPDHQHACLLRHR